MKNLLITIVGGLVILVVGTLLILLKISLLIVGLGLILVLTGLVFAPTIIRHPILAFRQRRFLLLEANKFIRLQEVLLGTALGEVKEVRVIEQEDK